jgi:hypothetical protein
VARERPHVPGEHPNPICAGRRAMRDGRDGRDGPGPGPGGAGGSKLRRGTPPPPLPETRRDRMCRHCAVGSLDPVGHEPRNIATPSSHAPLTPTLTPDTQSLWSTPMAIPSVVRLHNLARGGTSTGWCALPLSG